MSLTRTQCCKSNAVLSSFRCLVYWGTSVPPPKIWAAYNGALDGAATLEDQKLLGDLDSYRTTML
jgi:hypothetical protein